MPRTLGANTLSAIAAERAAAVHLLEVHLAGGTVYVNTSAQQIVVDTGDGSGSHTWTAIGGALSIGAGIESMDPQASGMDIEIAGVDQTALAAFLTSSARARIAKVWAARLDYTTGLLIDTPTIVCEGRLTEDLVIDARRPDEPGKPSTVTIKTRITGLPIELDQTRGIQMSPGSHQAAGFPGDNGFDFVARLPGRRITWGSNVIILEAPPT